MSKLTFCGAEVMVTRSTRKSIAVKIKPQSIIMRVPLQMSDREIKGFLQQKREWIEKHLSAVSAEQKEREALGKFSESELKAIAEKALEMIPKRVAHFAPLIGVSYGRITIRCQRTRWGSCSAKGNLNFNCLLVLMPTEVLDSVVVHELCHRKHMNHSPEFYEEIERVFPDHARCRKWLNENGGNYLSRLP